MKTVIIWNELDKGLSYAIVDGDLSRFHRTFVNSMDELEEELSALVYDDEGNLLMEFFNEFPLQFVKDNECIVIECGCLP